MNFKFSELALKGAYIIDNYYVGDNRGGFTKCFEKEIYLNGGIEFNLNETFVSVSAQNVVRGLHFQIKKPQAKLVTVLKGAVWDVIVDLRGDSLTYKKWVGIELSDTNHRSIYVPRGFAHGFLSKEDGTIMLYQCDGAYDNETDTGILYNDTDLNIEWPIKGETIHSQRDLQLMKFSEYEKNPMML